MNATAAEPVYLHEVNGEWVPVPKTKGPVWTRELASAAGKDAANRQMRKAGRKAWSRADYNLAVREARRLYPYIEVHSPEGIKLYPIPEGH